MNEKKFLFGIDSLLRDEKRMAVLRSARVGLVAHPASVTGNHQHAIDALMKAGCNVLRAFGPQHGMRGDKQDNMVESDDYVDAEHQLPVISLYGRHRKPTREMLEDLDIVLFDLQDVGCRIYTYITTLFYFAEQCSALGKELWVLDRPNPAGRPIDGLYLEAGQESFVGCAPIPTRHGLTVGELAQYFTTLIPMNELLTIVPMQGYEPTQSPGFGWPAFHRPWINPSPNASSLNMTRCFPGSVLIEGTTLSEGRGTTTPLELLGAPGMDIRALMGELKKMPHVTEGVILRECYFMPTFHKHAGALCNGIQIHTDFDGYGHEDFKPYRLFAVMLKLQRQIDKSYPLWRHHEYEYEFDRIPIDIINGGSWLRDWVDDSARGVSELLTALEAAEARWTDERSPYLLY